MAEGAPTDGHQDRDREEAYADPDVVPIEYLPKMLGFVETDELIDLRTQIIEVMTAGDKEGI